MSQKEINEISEADYAPTKEVILSADSRIWAAAMLSAIKANPKLMLSEPALELWFRSAIATGHISGQSARH